MRSKRFITMRVEKYVNLHPYVPHVITAHIIVNTNFLLYNFIILAKICQTPLSGSFLAPKPLLCTGCVPLKLDKCKVTSRDFLKFLSTFETSAESTFP